MCRFEKSQGRGTRGGVEGEVDMRHARIQFCLINADLLLGIDTVDDASCCYKYGGDLSMLFCNSLVYCERIAPSLYSCAIR